MLTSERVQSYPTLMSRVVALAGLIVIWTSFGARALQKTWAPPPTVTLAVAAGLIALSRNFNVSVRFRAPRDSREGALVRRLRLLKRAGAIGMVVSLVCLLAIPANNFVVGFLVPLCIFVASAALQGTSALLYRPFVVRDAKP